MSNAVVPAIPPLSGVQDPQTRAVLEALANGWLMRNGQTGEGSNAFLTRKDLEDLIQQVVIISNGGLGGGAGALGNPNLTTTNVKWPNGDTIRGLITAVQQYVLNSPALRVLQQKIEYIQAPEWLQERISKGFKEEFQGYADSYGALFTHLLTQGAKYDQSLALVQSKTDTIATATVATASKLDTVQASIGGTDGKGGLIAAVQTLETARTTLEGQLAAQYWIKLQTQKWNGKQVISGMSLYNDNVNTFAIFAADTFAVVSTDPRVPSDVPFVVKTTPAGSNIVSVLGEERNLPTYENAPEGVYMNAAFIADASIATAKIADATITTAKIRDAAIETLKIAGNAVTQPVGVTAGTTGVTPNTGNWTTVCTLTVVNGSPAPTPGVPISMLIGFSYEPFNTSGGNWESQYRVWHVNTSTVVFSGKTGIANNIYGSTVTSFDIHNNITSGTSQTYYLQIQHNGDTVGGGVTNVRMFALGAKR